MASAVLTRASRVPRRAAWDALFVALSVAHAVALVAIPSIPVIAVLLWWNANTVAHNFIHRPFFRSPISNRVYSAFLSLVLGVPQTLWRARHLRHHAGVDVRLPVSRAAALETLLVLLLWCAMAWVAPRFFFLVYLPGWALGLVLCQLQGYYEHARGTTSHYGRIYNALFFNDGFHVEHHRRPHVHWTELARTDARSASRSRWPPVLRWIDEISLVNLERLVLRSRLLQRFVIAVHERAFRRLLPAAGDVRSITVVGGGLFPRTALILRRLSPHARITIVDADEGHLQTARGYLARHHRRVSFVRGVWDPADPDTSDLVVLPLAFVGSRTIACRNPPARAMLVHDWVWRRSAVPHERQSIVISWLLLKRLRLLVRPDAP